MQTALEISLAKDYSLNQIRRRSKAAPGQPTTIDQSLKALASFGLPYDTAGGLDAEAVVRIAREKGPVLICYSYWSHPQWNGYTYQGRKLSGTARNNSGGNVKVGIARPSGQAGLTQWTYSGRHSAIVVGAFQSQSRGTKQAIIRDPNHNSASRPERPAYDLVTMAQLDRMLRSWGPTSLVLVPRRASNPPNVPSGNGGGNPPKPGPGDDPWNEPWLGDGDAGTAGGVMQSGLGSIAALGIGGAVLAGAVILGIAAVGMSMKGGDE